MVGSVVVSDCDAELLLAVGDRLEGDLFGPGDATLAGDVLGSVTLEGGLRVLRGGRVHGAVVCRALELRAGAEVSGEVRLHGEYARHSKGRGSRPPSRSVIPHGFRVEGDVSTEGDLDVEGSVTGDVHVGATLCVHPGGSVEGRIWAGEVVDAGHAPRASAERLEAPSSSPPSSALPEPDSVDLEMPRVGRVSARRRRSGPR